MEGRRCGGVSVPLCPQIDRYLKDKALTSRSLPSKAQLMSTTVCRPSKTNSARLTDLEREETFYFYSQVKRRVSFVVSGRKKVKKKGGGRKKEINEDIKAGRKTLSPGWR